MDLEVIGFEFGDGIYLAFFNSIVNLGSERGGEFLEEPAGGS
jgi:hypothetical protein